MLGQGLAPRIRALLRAAAAAGATAASGISGFRRASWGNCTASSFKRRGLGPLLPRWDRRSSRHAPPGSLEAWRRSRSGRCCARRAGAVPASIARPCRVRGIARSCARRRAGVPELALGAAGDLREHASPRGIVVSVPAAEHGTPDGGGMAACVRGRRHPRCCDRATAAAADALGHRSAAPTPCPRQAPLCANIARPPAIKCAWLQRR